MLLNKARTIGAVVGLLSGVFVLAGCSQPATSSAAPAALAGGGSSQAQGEGAMPVIPASVSGDDDTLKSSNCSARDFGVDLNIQPDRPGVLLMSLTNSSQHVCTVHGYVELVGTDMAGEELTQVSTASVAIPGVAEDVTLDPGESAFAGVHIEPGNKADASTFVATGFNAYPPSSDGGMVNANIIGTNGDGDQYFEFPMRSMEIGTLQPSRQGVLF
jgi:hypothetical protein